MYNILSLYLRHMNNFRGLKYKAKNNYCVAAFFLDLIINNDRCKATS